MKQPEQLNQQRWEQQVNALVDGDLAPPEVGRLLEEARTNAALDAMISDAKRLQALFDEAPRLRAPTRLRSALQGIPFTEKRRSRLSRIKPVQWAIAASLVMTVLITSVVSNERQETELEMARQDLAIAFGYLRRTTQRTPMLIASSVDYAAIQPITKLTVRTLSGQMMLNKE